MTSSATHRQLARFALVGVLSNATLFGAYCGLTHIGGRPREVMSVLYALGVIGTFVANRRWTFHALSAAPGAFRRYVALQAGGYAVNYAGLAWGTDRLGVDHRLVQAVMIGIVATLLFLGQRHWVFASARASGSAA